MAHTGTALHLGAESMHFNPAGMVYLPGAMDFSLGAGAVKPFVKRTGPDGTVSKTDNPISTPLFGYAAFRVLGDKLTAGVSVTTPYGNTVDWGQNWPGAQLVQEISLRAFVFQPTVGVKLLPNLSFGAGLMIGTGSFDLSRAMLGTGVIPAAGDEYPVSIGLKGTAKTAYGFNAGLLWDITPKWSVGVSYRSEMWMKVNSDDSKVTPVNDQVAATMAAVPALNALNAYNGTTFDSEIPMPSNLTIGFKYQQCKKILVALDFQFVGWSAYDKLQFTFPDLGAAATSTSIKNYRNTVTVRLGGSFECCENWTVRAGIYYDQTPVRMQYYSPDGPGANKLGFTLGGGYRPSKTVSIDLGATYIHGFPLTGSCPAPTAADPANRFGGDYKCSAWIASLGVGLHF
jgi:long-chain fatty acid transport protein